MDYIDKYADIQSIIHRRDARIKVISLFACVISVIITKPDSYTTFVFYGILILALVLLSKIPIKYILKRSLVIIPFILAIAVFIPFLKEGETLWSYPMGPLKLKITYQGVTLFWNILIKAYLSALCMILLTSSTRFFELLKAFEGLKMPKIMVMIFSFMHRYLFILRDELMIMKRAKDSRSINGNSWFHTKALSNMLGVLFIRSYERGEAVYLAMCSRGFDGSIRTMGNPELTKKDLYFLLIIITLLILGRFV
ncbi:cobalt ECF transporter T component CbiQ [Candidatus Poribacteria bacterium]|nr:cobalt ECF transporter T component CbiQ [Candidatus Poribacteria bacterium]